ncbi:unnamed protein product [Meloidogyne enterolobii]|uniref:Uncharacterized protein n=1 Tax=Meloidogyne enterolobii TaxID=390850 RepID=A0ACB0ZZC3_MELEN
MVYIFNTSTTNALYHSLLTKTKSILSLISYNNLIKHKTSDFRPLLIIFNPCQALNSDLTPYTSKSNFSLLLACPLDPIIWF